MPGKGPREGSEAVTLGLDIGTTSTIGVLAATDGRILATATRPATLRSPRPGWAEADPLEWWRNVQALVPELFAAAGIGASAIAGIGVAGMLPAVVLLDGAGRVLRPSIQQSDGRTGAEVEAMRRELDEAAFTARTGNGINQQLVGTKLRWLERHEPEVMARAATVMGAYDFINLRLTGERVVERNWALEAGFVDLATGEAAADLLAFAHLDPARLPRVAPGEAVIGAVTAEAAALTGLAAGTPVVAGAADHIASAFVAGIVRPGDVLLKFGGAGDIMLAADAPRPDPRLFLDYHIVPGRFMPNGCMAASGSLLNWLVREFAGGRDHAALDTLAASVPPGADGLVLLPYVLGEKTPIHDPAARGTLVGLGLHHRIDHLWRAALEAVVMGFRHHIEVAREIGHPVERLVASDGGSRSALWMQIAADALQLPVTTLDGHPGSCLGAAWVAAMGTGAADDWSAIARFTRPAATFEPDPANAPACDHLYGLYRETYDRLKPLYPKFAAP
ncbi:MAG: carbohydrate kinase [Geminicoccaceae bacterium]|nr:carbohydrate kinase [Geminicoccaceae bacterium]